MLCVCMSRFCKVDKSPPLTIPKTVTPTFIRKQAHITVDEREWITIRLQKCRMIVRYQASKKKKVRGMPPELLISFDFAMLWERHFLLLLMQIASLMQAPLTQFLLMLSLSKHSLG